MLNKKKLLKTFILLFGFSSFSFADKIDSNLDELNALLENQKKSIQEQSRSKDADILVEGSSIFQDKDKMEALKLELASHFSDGAVISGIEHSGIGDLHFFQVNGRAMIFLNGGKYLINGALFDLETEKNILDSYMGKYYLPHLEKFNEEDFIVFAPESEDVKSEIIVFTDPSCSYCQKLHRNVETYVSFGVKVKYLPYPRGGENGPGYNSLLKAWCQVDNDGKRQILENEKLNFNPRIPTPRPAVSLDCERDFKKILKKSEGLNISGTPSVYLENGEKIGGYVEPHILYKKVIKNK